MKRFSLRLLRGLAFLVLLLAALLAAGTILLVRFDLNRYRQPLEAGLSEALGLPVQLGSAQLTARTDGLAIDFLDGKIGQPQGELHALVPHLYARIALRPLLRGEVRLDQLLLFRPRVTVRLPATGGTDAGQQEVAAVAERLEMLHLRQLELSDGTLQLGASDGPQWQLTGLHGSLRNSGRATRLELSGHLQQATGPARLQFSAKLPALGDLPSWRDYPLDLRLQLEQLNLQSLAGPAAGQASPLLPAVLDLDLKLQGRTTTEATLAATGRYLTAEGGAESPLRLMLRWQSTAEQERIDGLQLTLGPTRVSGRLNLRHADNRLSGNLASPAFDLPPACCLLPTVLAERLSGSRLRDLRLRLDGPLPTSVAGLEPLLASAEARLESERINLVEGLSLTRLLGRLAYADGRLQLTDGRAQLLGRPIRFSGAIDRLLSPAPRLQAELTGDVDVAELVRQLSARPADLALSGVVPLRLALAGQLDQWQAEATTDIGPLAAAWPKLLSKTARQAGSLRLRTDSDRRLQATLELPPLRWSVTGNYAPTAVGGMELQLASSDLDLAALQPFCPILAEMRFRGGVATTARLRHGAAGWEPPEAELTLKKVGFHLWGVVADFNDIDTVASLRGSSLTYPAVSARWGKSPLRATGAIPDLLQPVARLDFTLPNLPANAIIFISPDAVLRDLAGTVRIHPDGLDFDPVRVRLDGGTKATVTGTMRSFRYPITSLHVDADYGDIEEVIRLFVGPEEGAKKGGTGEEEKAPVYGPVTVTVVARAGTLGDLAFEQATATVRNEQRQVVVEPLSFRAHGGSAEGLVRFDYNDPAPHLLEVSGRLEGVEADVVHRRFLAETGLVTGTLSSSFRIAGRGFGDAYLASSNGAIRVQVEKGVLRKFTVLSKIFSLLNVSQIIKGNLLPDMDREGMPFNRLTASFDLKDGVLSTEDLLVDSEAMNLSMVGSLDMGQGQVDAIIGVKPLVMVDRIVTSIPLVGWLLAGEERALVTAHFQIRGDRSDPDVLPIPFTSISGKVQGIFRRLLNLPGTVITDPGKLLGIDSEPPEQPADAVPPR